MVNPIKVDDDVKAVIHNSVTIMESLQQKIEEESARLRRVVARVYGWAFNPDNIRFAIIGGCTWVIDITTHTVVDGKIVPLPQPEEVEDDTSADGSGDWAAVA
jgi:hypothetical protein